MRRFALAVLLLALTSVACDESDPIQTPVEPDAAADVTEDTFVAPDVADSSVEEEEGIPLDGTLLIVPDRAVLVINDEGEATQRFTLQRRTGPRDIFELDPSLAEWSIRPPELGSIDPQTGEFTSAGQPGRVWVTARHDDDTVEAIVDLFVWEYVLEPGVPTDAPDRFRDAPAGTDCAPTIEYPADGTAFPVNLEGIEFQWQANGHDLFMVEFRFDDLIQRWFTQATELTPDGDAWTQLVQAANGGQLHFMVTGIGGQGSSSCASSERMLEIDPSPLEGAIYYWSTTDSGIMRLAAGDTEPVPFLTPVVAPEINCPACHALSRDGSRIAFTRTTFPPFGELFVSDVNLPRDAAFEPEGVIGYFPSWAPDNTRLVAGSGGNLVIRNASTGGVQEVLPMPEGMVAGSPDWSWGAGDRIVAAMGPRSANPLPDVGISQGSLAEWRLESWQWSEPSVLVEQTDDESNDRPAYSPDGSFVAFNRTLPSQSQNQGNANSDLYLMNAQIGAVPVRLDKANGGNGLGNSWPKWSPSWERGRLWLAFSSTRDYGHRLVNSANGADARTPQLWVTGIDPHAMAAGEDPSSPAFWLPYQDVQSGNHIPYWAPYTKTE